MATIMRDVVPGWQLINIISISSIIFLRTNSLAFAFSEEEKLKKVSCPEALPFLVTSFFCLCLKIIVSQSFRLFSALCCAFFHSRFALNFFFFLGARRMLFFSTTSTTTFDSSLKQKREKRKDFETFLSLFFPLFDTNTTTLTLLNEGREDEHALFFYSSSVL